MAGGRGKVADTLAIEATSASALVVGGAPGASSGTGGIKAGAIVSSSSVNDSVGSMATIRAGGIGIASQAALDVLFASSATQLGRLAKGTALQQLRMNAGATAYEFFTPPTTSLLELVPTANSGSINSGVATNVATLALASRLGANDSLIVMVSSDSSAGNVTTPSLLNTTDTVTLTTFPTQNGDYLAFNITIRPVTTTRIQSMIQTETYIYAHSVFTTSWSGAWTLALRYPGSSVAWNWKWAIYQVVATP